MMEPDEIARNDGRFRRALRDPDTRSLALGGLLLVSSLLPWYRVEFPLPIPGITSVSPSDGAWGLDLLAIGPVLIGVASAALAGLRLRGAAPRLPVRPGFAYMVAGIAAFALTLMRFLVEPREVGGFEVLGAGASKVTRGVGLYLALLLTLGMLVSGLLASQAEQSAAPPDRRR